MTGFGNAASLTQRLDQFGGSNGNSGQLLLEPQESGLMGTLTRQLQIFPSGDDVVGLLRLLGLATHGLLS